jgi:uncharacterized repeat protein (TIGR01451 family)
MKKGLLVALFGLTLVATLALPQMAYAQTPLPNFAEITGYTTPSGPDTVTLTATATVWLLGPVSLVLAKGVENVSRGLGGPSTTQVPAGSGDVVKYYVSITNSSDDQVTSVDFRDTHPVPGMTLCTFAMDPIQCVDLPPELTETAPGVIEDTWDISLMNPIVINSGQTITLIYTFRIE